MDLWVADGRAECQAETLNTWEAMREKRRCILVLCAPFDQEL